MSDILTVLDSLNPNNGEELAHYRERTPLVIPRLETPLVPPQNTRPSAHTYTEAALSFSATHQTTPELKHIIACEKILRLMKKRLARIKEYAKQSDQDAVSKASPTKEDFRIVDVRIHDNSDADERSETVRFRRLLAIRSFSHEFREFQRQNLTAARADIQTNYLLSSADQFQVGSVNDFICSKDNIFDRERAKKMVHEGTKLAVLEDLYGHCGISAVLWLAPSWVRLSYQDLTIFLELLLQDPRYGSVETASEELADWFERCQICYGDQVNNPSLSEDGISRQPICREMTKRKRTMPLKTAKPRKPRRLTIQHDISPVTSDGETRDKLRQEESRLKDYLFTQAYPPFSQALHHNSSATGCADISCLVDPPESATENPRDESTGQDLRPIQLYSSLRKQEHLEAEANAFPDIFDPRETAQLILPPDFGLLVKQTEDNLAHIFDPRQTVQPVHLPGYSGVQADGADNRLPGTFDPPQTVQPVQPARPPALFSLQERQADNDFDMFDPRQTAQLIIPPEFDLEGKRTEDDLSHIFDPRQTVQPVHPPECFSLQEDCPGNGFPDIFDPRQTVQSIHPPEYFGLQADEAGNGFPNVFDRWHVAQPILPFNTLPSQSMNGDDTLETHREVQREKIVHNTSFPFWDLAAHCT